MYWQSFCEIRSQMGAKAEFKHFGIRPEKHFGTHAVRAKLQAADEKPLRAWEGKGLLKGIA